MSSFRNLYQLEAAGSALSNTTAETVMASHTLPAYSAQVGKRYKVRGAVRATATNSTDTLQPRLRMGTVTLTGTVLADGTAVDAANDNLWAFELEGVVRAIGASGVIAWSGEASIVGAEGTVTERAAFEIDGTDLNADNFIQITGQWSVANAGNSAQVEYFTIDEIVG